MKMMQWIKIILLASSIITLAACRHHNQQGYDPYPDQVAVDEANAEYDENATSSGLGKRESLDEQLAAEHSSSKRTYYFDFDRDIVHENDKPAILANAKYLIAHRKAKVLLEGHTDPRGSREYNIGLGERRAKAVAQILRTKGVNSDQIRIVSYGAQKLAAKGHTEADYQLDRRVVLVYLRR